MAETYRIGVLGLTHDHVWSNLKELQETGRGRLVAAADPNTPLLERVQVEYGCATYTDYETLLANEQLDAVYIYSDNAASARLAEQAAERNLPILIEKPLAADLVGADHM